MDENSNNNERSSVDFNPTGINLIKGVTVVTNTDQKVIQITEDKLKLILNDTIKVFKTKRDWITPLCFLVSNIATFCTADFKYSLGLTKEVWSAFFGIFTLISGGMLVNAIFNIIRYRKNNEVNDFIKKCTNEEIT